MTTHALCSTANSGRQKTRAYWNAVRSNMIRSPRFPRRRGCLDSSCSRIAGFAAGGDQNDMRHRVHLGARKPIRSLRERMARRDRRSTRAHRTMPCVHLPARLSRQGRRPPMRWRSDLVVPEVSARVDATSGQANGYGDSTSFRQPDDAPLVLAKHTAGHPAGAQASVLQEARALCQDHSSHEPQPNKRRAAPCLDWECSKAG